MADELFVCIQCMTYNHKPYIRQALEGFVMQKTTFPYVAVVVDDFSNDGTADIVWEFAEKFPDIIKGICLTENYFSQGKLKRPLMEPWISQARYIALCEGDDCWTDPYKLQKQVDYLETHDDCVLCCHNAWQDFGTSRRFFVNGDVREHDISLKELLHKWRIPTASVVFRNSALEKVPFNKRYLNGDYSLEIRLKSQGELHYLPDVMSVYNMHSDSLSAGMGRNAEKLYGDLTSLLSDLSSFFPSQDQPTFDEAIENYSRECADIVRYSDPVRKWFYRKTYTRAIKKWLRSLL